MGPDSRRSVAGNVREIRKIIRRENLYVQINYVKSFGDFSVLQWISYYNKRATAYIKCRQNSLCPTKPYYTRHIRYSVYSNNIGYSFSPISSYADLRRLSHATMMIQKVNSLLHLPPQMAILYRPLLRLKSWILIEIHKKNHLMSAKETMEFCKNP